jgi:hypothetical protein
MSDMVLAMPGVQGQHFIQLEHTAVLGMPVPARKVGRPKVPQQQQPALMEEVE